MSLFTSDGSVGSDAEDATEPESELDLRVICTMAAEFFCTTLLLA